MEKLRIQLDCNLIIIINYQSEWYIFVEFSTVFWFGFLPLVFSAVSDRNSNEIIRFAHENTKKLNQNFQLGY